MSMRLAIRLLFLCAVPTAATAWMQMWMFNRADLLHWPTAWTLFAFGTIAAQTAATCGLAGQYLPTWPWRLPAVVWLLLLTNLNLASINMQGGAPGEGTLLVDLLVNAFSAAQIAALTIWIVLGDASFGQQAAVMSCLSVPLLMAVANLHLPLTDPGHIFVWGGAVLFPGTVLVQAAAVFVVSSVLHFQGFRISRRCRSDLPSPPIRQLSIRRLSMYVLVIACYSLAIKGFLPAANVRLNWRMWLLLLADGILLAAASLAAAWGILRQGSLPRRMALFLALAPVAGVLCAGMETALYAYLEATLVFNGTWAYEWMWVGRWWIAWTLLGSLFLASLLLVLRAAGYRLNEPHQPLCDYAPHVTFPLEGERT